MKDVVLSRTLRGRDVLTAKQIRASLAALNVAFDGPGGAVIVVSGAWARVLCADGLEGDCDAVVHLPGDGRDFPLNSFVAALLSAHVYRENQ